MKRIILFSCLLSIVMFANAQSQDTLCYRSGRTEIARVVEISQKEVKFMRQGNLNGPVYSMPTDSLSEIQYANGNKDHFLQTTKTRLNKKRFGWIMGIGGAAAIGSLLQSLYLVLRK